MRINKTLQFFGRLITAIIILGITAFFTPGFALTNIWILVGSILILTVVDFSIGCFTKLFYHPYIKLMIGFVFSCIALYVVQYFVIGYTLSMVPIILGAIIYGLVDYMLPNEDDKNNSENIETESTSVG